MMRRASLLLVALVLMAPACGPTEAETPRLSLFVGVDVSGSFSGTPQFRDSLRFLSYYLYGHLHGTGGLEKPRALFVGSIGGDTPNEPKAFYPIQVFERMNASEMEVKLTELFTVKGNYQTDFNAFFNRVSGISGSNVALATDDPYDADPGNFALSDGIATVSDGSICPRRAGNSAKITATHSSYGSAESSAYTLSHGAVNRLQVLARSLDDSQGEANLPGSNSGRTGAPASQNAGVTFPARVNLSDRYWNPVSAGSRIVKLVTTDPNDVDPATFTVNATLLISSITLTRAATTQILIYDAGADGVVGNADDTLGDSDGTDNIPGSSDDLSDAKTQPITVAAGSANRILLIHGAQTLNPGATSYATARVGGAGPYNAGSQFDVRVYLTDQFFNVKTGVADGAPWRPVPGRPERSRTGGVFGHRGRRGRDSCISWRC